VNRERKIIASQGPLLRFTTPRAEAAAVSGSLSKFFFAANTRHSYRRKPDEFRPILADIRR
jgi:hypothetical protein